jgi:hypothetical protein
MSVADLIEAAWRSNDLDRSRALARPSERAQATETPWSLAFSHAAAP